MSRNLTNTTNPSHRDYGATSSSSNVITTIPDVNFSGFSPTEFMSLSENIGSNMSAIKSSWMQLDKTLKQLETKNVVNQTIYDETQKIQTEANIKIETTTKDLQRLTAIVRRGDKQQKLQLEKLTSDFGIFVQKYSDSQKKIANKIVLLMKQFYMQQQILDDQEQNDDTVEMNEIQQQKLLKRNLEFKQEMLIERNVRIQTIENNVLDINTIMKKLGTIVAQQGENIDTIESSIDHSAAEVEAGAAELHKASEYRTRYRKKILILLAIAVIIGLIVTGIIVSQLKS